MPDGDSMVEQTEVKGRHPAHSPEPEYWAVNEYRKQESAHALEAAQTPLPDSDVTAEMRVLGLHPRVSILPSPLINKIKSIFNWGRERFFGHSENNQLVQQPAVGKQENVPA